MADRESILVSVEGPDRNGITAGLMNVLAQTGAGIQDVEQVIVRGRLTLSLVIDVPQGRDVLKELLLFGWENTLRLDFEVVEPSAARRQAGYVVTMMAPTIEPSQFGAVAEAVAGAGGNIDRIVRLSQYPVVSYELVVSGGELAGMQQLLGAASSTHGVDVAVQRAGLGRRSTRLVVVDMDSTLIQDEVIDLLAAEAGCEAEVAEITARAMAGELDFEAALRERTARLAGLDVLRLDAVRRQIRLTPGARTFARTLRRMGYSVAVVSGGFGVFCDPIAEELGFDHSYANELEIEDGRLTGRLTGRVIDRRAKADLLSEIAARVGVQVDQTVAIGDGANDIDMLAAAGLGIAFNAKPAVREAADASVNVPYLDAVLFLLGVTREEVEAADASVAPLTTPA